MRFAFCWWIHTIFYPAVYRLKIALPHVASRRARVQKPWNTWSLQQLQVQQYPIKKTSLLTLSLKSAQDFHRYRKRRRQPNNGRTAFGQAECHASVGLFDRVAEYR
jgi:hypothetical protein